MKAYDLAALVLHVLFRLVEFVVGRVFCEGDLASSAKGTISGVMEGEEVRCTEA
jgi:hypothetical protein